MQTQIAEPCHLTIFAQSLTQSGLLLTLNERGDGLLLRGDRNAIQDSHREYIRAHRELLIASLKNGELPLAEEAHLSRLGAEVEADLARSTVANAAANRARFESGAYVAVPIPTVCPCPNTLVLFAEDDLPIDPVHAGTVVYRRTELANLSSLPPEARKLYHSDKAALLAVWTGYGTHTWHDVLASPSAASLGDFSTTHDTIPDYGAMVRFAAKAAPGLCGRGDALLTFLINGQIVREKRLLRAYRNHSVNLIGWKYRVHSVGG